MQQNKERKKGIFDSNYFYFFIGFAIGVIILTVFGISKKDDDKTKSDFPQDYKIISPNIPGEMNFAGEKVPLKNFEVKERIDRELIVNTYWHSSTILAIKRANRWFPVIEPILKRYKIPDDFKYLAIAESNLSNVISPADAVGFWQFTEDAAKKYGLEINDQVDERYNVEKSTEAACKYLLDAHAEFKSWTLAAASFNMGLPGMQKQLDRQKADSYYNLVLGEETSRYVPRMLALKEIMTHPEQYGYNLKKSDLYPPLNTYNISISSPVKDWADFAISKGINYKILKYYNPWLRDNSLKNKRHITYVLKMPQKVSDEDLTDSE